MFYSPKIDGKLNEQLWNEISIAKDFTQIEPNNGQYEKFNQRTEVKICYDNRNIYFGAIMFDSSPDSILKELSKRDEENKNFDGFGIFINPFNDGQIEYKFFVTAGSTNRRKNISYRRGFKLEFRLEIISFYYRQWMDCGNRYTILLIEILNNSQP